MRVQLPRDPRRMGSFQVPGFQQPRPTPPASGPPRRTKAESTACGGIVRGYRSSARRGPHRIRSPITTSTPGTRNRPRNAVESDAGRRILSFRSSILTSQCRGRQSEEHERVSSEREAGCHTLLQMTGHRVLACGYNEKYGSGGMGAIVEQDDDHGYRGMRGTTGHVSRAGRRPRP